MVELLVAAVILSLVAGALGALVSGTQQTQEYADGESTAAQHARVALDRIARIVQEATANGNFPGAILINDDSGGWRLPDALVVWHPSGAPADPLGLPRFNELVIFCPRSDAANELVEITLPGDTRTAPAAAQSASWLAELQAIKSQNKGNRVVLTDLLRTFAPPSSLVRRGTLRFEVRLRPSDTEWSEYRAGTRAWRDMSWPQGQFGGRSGTRQLWVRTEMQLMPGKIAAARDAAGEQSIPFFGSAALYYGLSP